MALVFRTKLIIQRYRLAALVCHFDKLSLYAGKVSTTFCLKICKQIDNSLQRKFRFYVIVHYEHQRNTFFPWINPKNAWCIRENITFKEILDSFLSIKMGEEQNKPMSYKEKTLLSLGINMLMGKWFFFLIVIASE